jgi:hypothetical protein
MPYTIKPELIEQDHYEVALRLARERWQSLDPVAQAVRCGATVREGASGERIVSFALFEQPLEVMHPAGAVRWAARESAPPLWEQILVLHYLCSQRAIPTTDRVIGYSEIPHGTFYDQAFQRRTSHSLLKLFGAEPDRLLVAAHRLGAERVALGDVSVRVHAFPRVDLYAVLWRRDEEFPPNASILLGQSIIGFLDAEDIAVLASVLVSYLAKATA